MLSVGHVTGEAGHVTRVKGLFIIRDISTIYRQSLDIFHEIVTFYNIYNYNKGKPYKQTVNRRFFSGSGDAEAFKFNFSLFLLFFFFFFARCFRPFTFRSRRGALRLRKSERVRERQAASLGVGGVYGLVVY